MKRGYVRGPARSGIRVVIVVIAILPIRLGAFAGRRPQHGSVACWASDSPSSLSGWGSSSGPVSTSTELGHSYDAEGRTRPSDQWPTTWSATRSTRHPGRRRRHLVVRSWTWLTAVVLAGIYFIKRDRRGVLPDQAVPGHLPRVQASAKMVAPFVFEGTRSACIGDDGLGMFWQMGRAEDGEGPATGSRRASLPLSLRRRRGGPMAG